MFSRRGDTDLAMSLRKDLIFLILQFCDEENLKKTAHMLEQETCYFFDVKHFEDLIIDGNWENAEKYLSSFTGVEDNQHSTKIYFEIRKQKFLEALDKHDSVKALEVLVKDLKVFEKSNSELYKEMAQLLILDDFREYASLANYGDVLSARRCVANSLRCVVEANPLLEGKTRFPQFSKSRLRRLINHSLNWQHIHCGNPHHEPSIDTLFTDHKCPCPDNVQDQFQDEISLHPKCMSATESTFSGNSAATNPLVAESLVSSGAVNLGKSSSEEDSDTSNVSLTENLDEKVQSDITFKNNSQDCANEPLAGFPKTVKRILEIGTPPTSMDFHPLHQTVLLVGTNLGGIEIWDVSTSELLLNRQFMLNEDHSMFVLFMDTENFLGISVNRMIWSPDGTLFGVAYSKRLVRLYSYDKTGNHIDVQLQIDAHDGGVNDLAFSNPLDKLVAVSCGDDKMIQVWDATSGAKMHTFKDHEAPVYSIRPHVKENVHFLFSVSTYGEIKAWLFDNLGSRVTYDAPGRCCMRMIYSRDGKRLFSCGTNQDGESHLVEWNEAEGFITRNYLGLGKSPSAVVQFDTSGDRFLAAGDNHSIKVWDVDNDEMLASIDSDGDLPANPCLCFNKKGALLAVFSNNNQIKILANDHGFELLETPAILSSNTSGCLAKSFGKEDVSSTLENGELREAAESNKFDTSVIPKIVGISRCRSVLLTSEVKTDMIRRLLYTNAGNGVLALAQDGIHLLWRWSKTDSNSSGEATTKVVPQLWKPKQGLLMRNDLSENSSDIVAPCFSLSRNDSYVVSTSGRMISLYNMLAFKKIRNVLPSLPAATCIVFYPPDNNIIAIGMNDSTILIYNIRVNQVKRKLEGHSNRISGLAFSTTSNVLISAGVNTQIIVWDSITWEKMRSTMLHISASCLGSIVSETNVELAKDQKQFLVVHETQLSIYEVDTLQPLKQWSVDTFCTRISHATYSCNSQLVYAVMRDGILLILGASDLTPRFEIDPLAYLPPRHSCSVYPLVIAAHPHKPDQPAVGLSNGRVAVIEPDESSGYWNQSTCLDKNEE